jgi:ABC-type sugar transport system substrate-binding protein
MITFVRTATIAPGKVAEALAFAHQVAKLVEKITDLKVGVSMPVSGNPFRIAWVAAEPDLASVEANTNKLMGDAQYMQLVESSASLFLPGSVHDEMWRGV